MTKRIVGRPIQKGQVLNPRGAGAHDPGLKAARKLSREQVAELGSLLLDKSYEELELMAADKKNKGTIYFILRQMMSAGKGSGKAFDRIFDRIVGKVQDDIKVSADVDVKISGEQVAAMAKAALKGRG